MHRSKKLRLLIGGLLLFIVIAIIPLAASPDKLNLAHAMFNSRKTENDTHGNWVRGPHIMKASTPNRVLYVAPFGNDANDGSKQHPFATINHAAQVVTPGTIVFVLPGTYEEAVKLTTDGTPDQRISFYSTKRWGAKIHTSNSDVPWTTDADYVDIVGFDISSSGSRDGLNNDGSGIRTIGNHIHDIPGVCDTNGGSGMTDGGYNEHDNDIIGNVVNNIGSTYPLMCQYVHAIYHSNARGHIYNNIAYHNAGNGINLWHAATGAVVANNLVFDNREHGISYGTDTDNTNGVPGDNFIVSNNISISSGRLGIREREGVLGHNQILNNFVTCSGSGNFGDETYDWPSAVGTTDKNTFSPRCWYNPTPSVHWSPTPASTPLAQGTSQQEIDEATFNAWQQAITGMPDDPGTLQQETDATTNSWQKALTNTVVDQGTAAQETDTTAVSSWPQMVLSIIIDHGTDVGAPHFDYYGRKRPQGKGYDIGPFEIA